MAYRVHYGNGSVGNSQSLAKAIQELKSQIEFDVRHKQGGDWYCIQKQDNETGEWFKINLTSEQIEKAESAARHGK